jgi:hypothetical protein
MEKISNLCTGSNPYVFTLYIIHPQITINIKIVLKTTKNENNTKSKKKNQQLSK